MAGRGFFDRSAPSHDGRSVTTTILLFAALSLGPAESTGAVDATAGEPTLLESEGEPASDSEVEPEAARPTTEGVAGAAGEPSSDWLKLTLALSYELKHFSFGLSFRYLDYLQTHVATDFLLTALLMGLGLDDLNAFRVTLSETAGARVTFSPFEISSRYGPRPPPGPIPHLVVGFGLWGLVELDSLAQVVRLGDAGVFVAASGGLFATLVFSAIDVSFQYRPISSTGYYLDDEWDATELQFGNPVLEVSLTYTFPW
jgi:hypothetical protein